MGIFDRAREAPQEHPDAVDPVVDRLADEADKRGGGQHRATIDRAGDVGADHGEDQLDDRARRRTTSDPGTPA